MSPLTPPKILPVVVDEHLQKQIFYGSRQRIKVYEISRKVNVRRDARKEDLIRAAG